MQKHQGIILILIFAILIICYFAPLTTIDTFANITKFNPQGSYLSLDTINPGAPVEQWKIGQNLNIPGNLPSLNLTSLKTSFPYNKFLPNKYKDGDINLVKSDGVILGGYMPQIIRPFDSVTANPKQGSKCKWPCYSDRKFQQWCSEENAINYHAMRPIISPREYNNNLYKLFEAIKDKNGPSNGKGPNNNQYSKVDTAVFCTETQKSIMSWLMQKIALQVSKMPEMQKNGPWKTEMFYDTDVQMYQYVNPDKTTYFKIIFNLYNPLRSVSTMIYATIYLVKDKPSLVDIDFINKETMEDYTNSQNGYGPITGYNFTTSTNSTGAMDIILPEEIGFENSPEGRKQWEKHYKKNPNQFDWNYMNTLEVQKFNKDGFYSNVSSDNINIEGGVPESLKKVLRHSNCNNANLLSCMTPSYNGIGAVSAKALNEGKDINKDLNNINIDRDNNYKITPLNGSVKNVYSNPSVIYSSKDNISLRSIETPTGTIYI